MSEPAVFALIRDGETRYFADRWASATLRREVLWGPDDFEAWVTQFDQLDEWSEDIDGGAVVDFDKRTMLWSGDVSSYRIPRIWQIYSQLLNTAWPGFQVKAVGSHEELVQYLGITRDQEDDAEDEDDEEEDENDYESRPSTVKKARFLDPDDEEEAESVDDDTLRAWVTLIDEDGSPRQRHLTELSLDVLQGLPKAIKALAELPPATIPQEAAVVEGLLLDLGQRTARIWGPPELLSRMKKLGKLWKGWQLKWTHRGYAEQCAASGTKGLPMSDVEVLAKILPVILSTEQFNLGAVVGAIGGGVKKFAKKATGCLIVVLCIPLLLFGVFSGNWMAVLYSILATIVVIVGLYLLIARKFRKAVTNHLPKQGDEDTGPFVAGPHEEQARKARIDQLLVRAKLPRIAEVEPHFPEESGLELLAT